MLKAEGVVNASPARGQLPLLADAQTVLSARTDSALRSGGFLWGLARPACQILSAECLWCQDSAL